MTDEIMIRELKKAWKARELLKRDKEAKRREAAWQSATKAAALLKENYSVKKVYLFGSLVWGKHYTAYSDIDLYVEGFPSEADYFEALGQAEYLAAPFPLNLVLEEKAPPGLKYKACKDGVRL